MPDTWKTLIGWIATVAFGLLFALSASAVLDCILEYPSNDFRIEVIGWQPSPALHGSTGISAQLLLLTVLVGVETHRLHSRGWPTA